MDVVASGATEAFLQGGGEMGAHIRAHDWSKTSLGPPSAWPQGLRTAVRLMLNSGHPIYIFWGVEGLCFYNDAYSHSIGPERHPGSLGKPAREVWDEIWPIIGPQIEQVMGGGPATWFENALVPITRNGKREDVYWTYSYSPIDDEGAPNGVGGVIVLCAETTQVVLERQRTSADKQRLAGLFEQAPGFMAVLSGPNHVFDITNAAYLKLIGHRDVIGQPVREALPEIEGQGFFELLDKVYATGEAFVGKGLSAQIQQQPGGAPETRFIDLIYQPTRDADGKVNGIFVQGHDITDQKLAEMAAAESEARFRLLAQSMPNHVWTALPDGNLDWFNAQVYAYSGEKLGDLDGQKWAKIVHPDDMGEAAQRWAEALKTGQNYKTEFRLRRADGVYRWHIARAAPIFDEHGKIEHWVGSNTDIEDQKDAEEALRESNLRVRLALESAEMGVWQCFVVDGKFENLTGDATALALLGGRADEPASFEAFAARIHPEDRERLMPAATEALSPDGDGVLDLDYRVVPRGDEPERWVHARAQTVAGPGGLRLIGTVRDITQRKTAEEQQTMLSRELQHRIKNTLAMVSAIATQTLRGEDIAERRANFNARIASLARAHDMLMASSWSSAPIQSVVESAIEAHRSSAAQFEIGGPVVELTPQQAMSTALAVHELATNAAKYGALSVDGGRVHIDWRTDTVNGAGERVFSFQWREDGGPPVVAPKRQGFGSRLVTKVFPADFKGEVRIEYLSGGVVCSLIAPIESIRIQAPASEAQ